MNIRLLVLVLIVLFVHVSILPAQQPSLPVADLQGTTLSATCAVGQRFMRTGAATEPLGQEWYVCSQANRWSRINQKIYNVQAYGAVGNSIANDTVAIQAAITAASTAGGIVYFPPASGVYLFSRLVVSSPGVYLECAGRRVSPLQTTVTTASVIAWTNTSGTAMSGGGMSHCTVYGSIPNTVPLGTETGLVVSATGAGRWDNTHWEDLEFRFLANGVSSAQEVDGYYKDVTVQVTKKNLGVGLYSTYGLNRFVDNFATYNVPGDEGLASIRIGPGSIGDFFNNASLLGSIDGVLMDPDIGTGPPYGNVASWGHFSDLYTDSMTGCGVNITPQVGGAVNLWVFNNTWTSNVVKGVCVAGAGTTSNMQFNGGRIRSSGDGFHLTTGTSVQIRGANIDVNGGNGIYASNSSKLDIKANTITGVTGYGVYLTGATDQIDISGNTIKDNVAGSIFDDTGLLNKWIGDNQGIDQSGQIVASNATIAIDPTPRIALSGATTVTTITAAPNWGNRRIYITATDASPARPTLSTGGNIGNTLSLYQYETATCVYSTSNSKWYCSQPATVSIPLVLDGQNAAISGNIVAVAQAGLYHLDAYLHTTTASVGACTSDFTIGWTFNGAAKALTIITAHDQNTDENASQATMALRSNGATAITYAVTLAGGANCNNAVYGLDLVLDRK